MSNYAENKKTLDEIKSKYNCAGDVIFRTATQYVVEYGKVMFEDAQWVQSQFDQIDAKHNTAEAEGKNLWIGREFEKACVECAAEIAKVNTYDLLIYIQKEMYWSDEGGLDYQRAIELLKKCIYDIEERENCEDKLLLQALDNIGFFDSEIEELGFGYLFNTEEEN